MKRFTGTRMLSAIAIAVVVWVILGGACLLVGSTGSIGLPQAAQGGVSFATLRFRLDNVLLASLIGCALASAGVVYQAVLRNPLAEPYLLGVSSGASLAAFVWQLPLMTGLLGMIGLSNSLGQQFTAFLGAIVAIAIVFTLATRRGRIEPVTLLLVGVIINAVNGSIFLLLNSLFKDPAMSGGAMSFLVGGMPVVADMPKGVLMVVVIGFGILLSMAGSLNVASLSDAEAEALGVRIVRLRQVALIVASVMTASVVALSGPIGFVGLVCPHVARLIVGTDVRRLLPLSAALGAGLLAMADAISRILAHQGAVGTTLPVGVLTGLLGGPFFLAMLWRGRKSA